MPTSSDKIKKKKKQTIASVNKDVEKLEPSYIAGRGVKWCNYFGKQSDSSLMVYITHMTQKFHSYLTIHPREIKTYMHVYSNNIHYNQKA